MAALSSEPRMRDFGFGFIDVNFSDRIMRIEILPDCFGFKPDPDLSVGDLAPNPDETEERDKQILNRNRPDLEDGDTDGNLESVINHSGGVRVRNVIISSLILGAKSPFFYKLFSNGMMESQQPLVTLQIQASEEDAVLDLLKYMYTNTLTGITPEALLDVLTVADKYEVVSCMRYCVQLLCSLPMTVELALLYLDYPSNVFMADTIQQLTKAAKQFLVDHFKDLSKCKEEVLKLSLAGIETVLSSDDLQVASEDDIYDIVVKWAHSHYPELQERRDVLRKLFQLVRYPFMSYSKLKQVIVSGDMDPELASKSVMDALFFKAKYETCHVEGDVRASNSQYTERSYTSRPVKVVQFESPRQQCIVYWDLKHEECGPLLDKREMHSWKFNLGGQGFYLAAVCCDMNHEECGPLLDKREMHSWKFNLGGQGSYLAAVCCDMNQEASICFRLFLDKPEKQPPPRFMAECVFAVRMLSYKEFIVKSRQKVLTFERSYYDLFNTPWSVFMSKNSPYFIKGVVHLKLELCIC